MLVKAKDLKVGQILRTGDIVTVAPSAGLKTPRGKVDIVFEGNTGVRKWKTWNKNTEIAIEDEV